MFGGSSALPPPVPTPVERYRAPARCRLRTPQGQPVDPPRCVHSSDLVRGAPLVPRPGPLGTDEPSRCRRAHPCKSAAYGSRGARYRSLSGRVCLGSVGFCTLGTVGPSGRRGYRPPPMTPSSGGSVQRSSLATPCAGCVVELPGTAGGENRRFPGPVGSSRCAFRERLGLNRDRGVAVPTHDHRGPSPRVSSPEQDAGVVLADAVPTTRGHQVATRAVIPEGGPAPR